MVGDRLFYLFRALRTLQVTPAFRLFAGKSETFSLRTHFRKTLGT